MKERELREAATCGVCHNPIGKAGAILFYRVRIERYGVKFDALRRQTGLEIMMGGNAQLAQAFSPDEDMAVPVMEPVTFTVCQTCSTRSVMVADLAHREDATEATPEGT